MLLIYNAFKSKLKVMNVIGFKPGCIIWFKAALTPNHAHSFSVFVLRSGNSTDSPEIPAYSEAKSS